MFGEQELYKFTKDGGVEVASDPLRLRRAVINASQGRAFEWVTSINLLQKRLKEIQNVDVSSLEDPKLKEQILAERAEWSRVIADIEGQLAIAAFQAFDLLPLGQDDEGNVTGIGEVGALRIMQEFLEWLEKKDDRSGTKA